MKYMRICVTPHIYINFIGRYTAQIMYSLLYSIMRICYLHI